MIITPETLVEHELETCNQILELPIRLHVRKPHISIDDLRKYLDQIDPKFHKKLSLHQHHMLVEEYPEVGLHWKSNQKVNQEKSNRSKSFHSWREIEKENSKLDYGFLSPIFDSITKNGYKAVFDHSALQRKLSETKHTFPIYALGGVHWDNIERIEAMGFAGIAILGAFWNMNDHKRRFKLLKHITHGNSKR